MTTRHLPLVSALLAGGLAVAAGAVWLVQAVTPPAPEPLLVVEPEAFDLALPPGDHTLVVRVTNPAGVPRQIIGLAPG